MPPGRARRQMRGNSDQLMGCGATPFVLGPVRRALTRKAPPERAYSALPFTRKCLYARRCKETPAGKISLGRTRSAGTHSGWFFYPGRNHHYCRRWNSVMSSCACIPTSTTSRLTCKSSGPISTGMDAGFVEKRRAARARHVRQSDAWQSTEVVSGSTARDGYPGRAICERPRHSGQRLRPGWENTIRGRQGNHRCFSRSPSFWDQRAAASDPVHIAIHPACR